MGTAASVHVEPGKEEASQKQFDIDIKSVPDETIIGYLKNELAKDPARMTKLLQQATGGGDTNGTKTEPAGDTSGIGSGSGKNLTEDKGVTTAPAPNGNGVDTLPSPDTPENKTTCDDGGSGSKPFFFDDIEFQMLQALNEARTNPKSIIPMIQSQLDGMDENNVIWVAGRSVGIKTHEGKLPFEEAIAFLKEAEAVGPITASYGMTLAARDHCADIGLKNEMGHKGGDDSSPSQRVERYGKWKVTMGENLDFGDKSGREAIASLIVDDGTASRGHRKNIFNPAFKVVGIAAGVHARFGKMFVNDMAGGFEEGVKEAQDEAHKAIVANFESEGMKPAGICPGCDKAVYEPEQGTTIEGVKWHNRCVLCQACGQTMHSFVTHEGKPMCRPCYESAHALKCSECQQVISGKYMMEEERAVCETCFSKREKY